MQTKFSFVLATIGRVEELGRFLESLAAQHEAEFDLIVIDQNADDRLLPLLNSYSGSFPITHLRSERGLSRARNVGLPHITGDIVAFPDDDCWYAAGLLKRVAQFLSEHPELDGVTGRPAGPSGIPWPGWTRGDGILDRRSVWRRGISVTIFLRDTVVKSVGKFDETLGAGAGTPWGAAEESDYLLRAMDRGFRVYDEASVIIHHHQPVIARDAQGRKASYSGAAGAGRVLRKHGYRTSFVAYHLLRRGIFTAFLFGTGQASRALQRWDLSRGIVRGYFSTPGEG